VAKRRTSNSVPHAEERIDPVRGKLLYVETLPKAYQQSKWFKGNRRILVNAAVRFAEAALFVAGGLIITTQDLSVVNNAVTAIMVVGGFAALIYLNDIRGPRLMRESTPILIYEKGVEIYGTRRERKKGRYGFFPAQSIARVDVLKMKLRNSENSGEVEIPSRLRFVMQNGQTISSTRRRPKDIESMAKIIGERLGVVVKSVVE
jgi:hypothetical protein